MNEINANRSRKKLVIIGIVLLVAMVHIVRPGQYLDGRALQYYQSFFSDIALPFAAYFLLCLTEMKYPILRGWLMKSLLVFAAAAFAEIMQGFGFYFLGLTFDPLDFLMYAIGALVAAAVEKLLFERAFSFWKEAPR